MLLKLKKYIQEKGDASLGELCREFDVDDADVMRKMLEPLIKKGIIRKKQSVDVPCTKCPQCPSQCGNSSEIYEWVC